MKVKWKWRERLRARRLRYAAELINSDRHILESRCADHCANEAFLTSFRVTVTGLSAPYRPSQLLLRYSYVHFDKLILDRKKSKEWGRKEKLAPFTWNVPLNWNKHLPDLQMLQSPLLVQFGRCDYSLSCAPRHSLRKRSIVKRPVSPE